jgi:quercetin dioxygenase-like cupin family protein
MNRRIMLQMAAIAAGSSIRGISAASTELAGFRVSAGDDRRKEHIKLGGSRLDSKVTANDSRGALAIFEHTTPGEGGAPLHLHLNQDEWWYVVEGEYAFQVGEERYTAKAGDTVWCPRHVPHGFAQVSPNEGKYIIAFQPAGDMEAFFRAAGKFTKMPTPEEWDHLFREHGMQYIGPFSA